MEGWVNHWIEGWVDWMDKGEKMKKKVSLGGCEWNYG